MGSATKNVFALALGSASVLAVAASCGSFGSEQDASQPDAAAEAGDATTSDATTSDAGTNDAADAAPDANCYVFENGVVPPPFVVNQGDGGATLDLWRSDESIIASFLPPTAYTRSIVDVTMTVASPDAGWPPGNAEGVIFLWYGSGTDPAVPFVDFSYSAAGVAAQFQHPNPINSQVLVDAIPSGGPIHAVLETNWLSGVTTARYGGTTITFPGDVRSTLSKELDVQLGGRPTADSLPLITVTIASVCVVLQ